MESVIFQDSPLAEYLEGQGKGGPGWTSAKPTSSPDSPESASFAPRGLPVAYSRHRRQPLAHLQLETPPPRFVITRLHATLSKALNSRLRRSENAKFLEQFRYCIIASQLLNDHVNSTAYNRRASLPPPPAPRVGDEEEHKINVSLLGLGSTAGAAFILVWSIHWSRSRVSRGWGVFLVLSVSSLLALVGFVFLRRQQLHSIRRQVIEQASSLVTSSQSVDAATSAAFSLIQEVELVSRGYRISYPLPPISRLEDQSQTRRCARLRRILKSSLSSLLIPYAEASEALRPLAVELDLEKYHDIYEISQSDIQDVFCLGKDDEQGGEDAEALKFLKLGLQRLYLVRKLFLCSLLALDADGSKYDLPRWSLAINLMQDLSTKSTTAAFELDKVLIESDRFSIPPTPKVPLTPHRERTRAQMRKLGALSQGIRGLQAKMAILREESDRCLDVADDTAEVSSNLLVQYDSIGADLKSLMQEWEDGRAALALNIDKNEKRRSRNSAILSRSSTPNSLGGRTAVSGSPSEALKILNGELLSPMGSVSSDEEVFEAVGLPRQRSTLTREERIAKMQEDRIRLASVREKAEANTNMMRELETVIKLLPKPAKGRSKGRITSI